MRQRARNVFDLFSDLSRLLEDAEFLNDAGSEFRSRELSLAITRIEEALHWLRSAHEKQNSP